MSYNRNRQKQIIEAVINLGYNILEIERKEIEFYLAFSFEPPVVGAGGSSPYLQASVIEFTDFMSNSVYSEGNITLLNSNVEKLVRESKKMSVQFSQNFKWTYYAR